ncbi:13820_t:CDS:2, partial [Acaulospora colombiana]
LSLTTYKFKGQEVYDYDDEISDVKTMNFSNEEQNSGIKDIKYDGMPEETNNSDGENNEAKRKSQEEIEVMLYDLFDKIQE